jgi:hypothetical protein
MESATSTWIERRSRPDLADDLSVVAGRGDPGRISLATLASVQREEIQALFCRSSSDLARSRHSSPNLAGYLGVGAKRGDPSPSLPFLTGSRTTALPVPPQPSPELILKKKTIGINIQKKKKPECLRQVFMMPRMLLSWELPMSRCPALK